MSRFKYIFDLSEKQKEFLELIQEELVDAELSKKLEHYIADIMEEAYLSGERDGYKQAWEYNSNQNCWIIK
jgi:hypothetical protein